MLSSIDRSFMGYWLLAIASSLLLSDRANARAYLVGDDRHWDLGVDYAQWASKYSFVMGQDSLVFIYTPPRHSVLQVTQGDFDGCNINNPIATIPPNSSFAIASPKAYFICGVPGHCVSNLKLAITATTTAPSRNITATAPEFSSSPPPPSPPLLPLVALLLVLFVP
ncbi:mavicyanin [Selaginella moellendorffii]|nr:mavicyanin [Selaginella moellendorffii]|eukprot:XP_002986939.2 mavicyanin [Selaginella moellendorffii]